MSNTQNALVARVNGLRKDIYNKGRGFASLMGVNDLKDPRFVAWQSEVAHVISLNPKLLRADRESLLESLRTAMTMSLSINPLMGEAYLIPRWNSGARCELVQCQIGYQGLKALMFRSEMIDSIHVDVAYRGEEFTYISGSDPKIDHRPDITGELRTNKFDDITCAYASIMLKGSDRPIVRLVTKRELRDARNMNLSRDGNPSMPWRDHTEAMCWKVALARATKSAPRAKGLAKVHDLLNEEAVRVRVEQIDPPTDAPPPESDEPSRWEIACEHFGSAGVNPEQMMGFLDRSEAGAVLDGDLDRLERLWADARSGVDEAITALESMKTGATAIDVEAK